MLRINSIKLKLGLGFALLSVGATACNVDYERITYVNAPGAASPTSTPGGSATASPTPSFAYEYIYFGDDGATNLAGYQIDPATGILSAISTVPAVAAVDLVLGKVSADVQNLAATLDDGTFGVFSIDRTTGNLTAVAGGTNPDPAGQGSGIGAPVFDLSGLFLYTIDLNSYNSAWTFALDAVTGALTNPTQSADFDPSEIGATYSVLSPSGHFVYFFDPYDLLVSGFEISSGALSPISGVSSGSGATVGDVTYFSTTLPPAGYLGAPYLDSVNNVLYFLGGTYPNAHVLYIYPYQIGSDGSLTALSRTSVGPYSDRNILHPNNFLDPQPPAAVTVYASGKYLFLAKEAGGIASFAINPDGSVQSANASVALGSSIFESISVDASNQFLVAGDNNGNVNSLSMNLTNGNLTSLSTVNSGCSYTATLSFDPSGKYLYQADPNDLCGYTLDGSGNLAAITGQSYPIAVPNSSDINVALPVGFISH